MGAVKPITRSARRLPGRRWLTVPEAAEYSRFSIRAIRKKIAEGTLPAYIPRGSRVHRIDVRDLDDMIIGEGRIPTAHLGDAKAGR